MGAAAAQTLPGWAPQVRGIWGAAAPPTGGSGGREHLESALVQHIINASSNTKRATSWRRPTMLLQRAQNWMAGPPAGPPLPGAPGSRDPGAPGSGDAGAPGSGDPDAADHGAAMAAGVAFMAPLGHGRPEPLLGPPGAKVGRNGRTSTSCRPTHTPSLLPKGHHHPPPGTTLSRPPGLRPESGRIRMFSGPTPALPRRRGIAAFGWRANTT